MFASPVFDVAGPGVFLIAGGLAFAVFSFGTLVIETLVLWLLKWDTIGRSLLAAFLMNLASTILGIVLFGLSILGVSFFSIVFLGFLLSFLVEGGILMLIKKGAARQNWIASVVANVASYGLLLIGFLLFTLLPLIQ